VAIALASSLVRHWASIFEWLHWLVVTGGNLTRRPKRFAGRGTLTNNLARMYNLV